MGRFPDPLVTKISTKLVEPVWEPLEKLEKQQCGGLKKTKMKYKFFINLHRILRPPSGQTLQKKLSAPGFQQVVHTAAQVFTIF